MLHRGGGRSVHAVLMLAAGFLGTLISLERAASLGAGWTYLAPLPAARDAHLARGAPALAWRGPTISVP